MEINDDDLKAEEIINNNLKTKKIKDIQLKIQPQAKKKVEKILGYESGNQVMKGIIYWLKRKLNKKNLIYIFDKEKKILEKFENFDDYIKLNTINNKKDFDYLHSKYEHSHFVLAGFKLICRALRLPHVFISRHVCVCVYGVFHREPPALPFIVSIFRRGLIFDL